MLNGVKRKRLVLFRLDQWCKRLVGLGKVKQLVRYKNVVENMLQQLLSNKANKVEPCAWHNVSHLRQKIAGSDDTWNFCPQLRIIMIMHTV